MATVDLSSIDLLALIGADTTLKRAASTNGGEWAGPCPFCGGRDRFSVQPNAKGKGRWFCRGCGDGRWHDAVDYVRRRDSLGFREALGRLGIDGGGNTGPRPSPRLRFPEHLAPPGPTWQAAARAFRETCRVTLWAPDGARPLAWLRKRGLSDETIRAAGLGYNPGDRYDTWETWGLEPRKGKRGVWLPRGIVIPWVIGGNLWRVNIRRPLTQEQLAAGAHKYIGPAGFANGLYNASALITGQPAMLVEGELDALTIAQEAGDLVAPVATGATGGARRTRWIARLALCSVVLVAFDADDPGEAASAYWLEILDNARRWRPYWEDANAMAQAGADVRAWVAAGVRWDTITLSLPADTTLAVPADPARWQRQDGRILATYTPEELTLSVKLALEEKRQELETRLE